MGDHMLRFILICSSVVACASIESGKSYIQECTNCKVSKRCGRYVDKWKPTTKEACFDKLNTKNYLLVGYQAKEQQCKAFNCTMVEENDGYSIVMITHRSDCFRYKITTKQYQEGKCLFFPGVYASIPDEHICLQLCLNLTGCLGSTYKKISETCLTHSCNDSKYKRSGLDLTFVGITCLGLHSTSNQPVMSTKSQGLVMSTCKHNVTHESTSVSISNTIVTDNGPQLKTYTKTRLPVFSTKLTDTTPDSTSVFAKTTTSSPYTMLTIPMSSVVTESTTQSIHQKTTTISTVVPTQKSFKNQSTCNVLHYMATNSFASPYSEEASLTTEAQSSVSPISPQAKTADMGGTVHDSVSSAVLTYTHQSNRDTDSSTTKRDSTETMHEQSTLTPNKHTTLTEYKYMSSDQFYFSSATVVLTQPITSSSAHNFFTDPVNRLAIAILSSIAFLVIVFIIVYCILRKKWKTSTLSQPL